MLVAAVNSTKSQTGGSGRHLPDSLPWRRALHAHCAGVGFVSSLMGIGGGAISNMVLTLHGMPIHRAVSTSAGVGVLIAVPGTLGQTLAGWGTPGLPPDVLGFVSLATFVFTMPASLATARLGVGLAHRHSWRQLELVFGIFLIAASLRFVWAILSAAIA
jgi:uncharacterized membrane protein YfcA